MLVEIELMGEILVELFDQNDPNRVEILGQSFAWQKTLKHCTSVMADLDLVLKDLQHRLKVSSTRNGLPK